MATVETARPQARPAGLTWREAVVLSELDEHRTLEEIATRLFVTRNTVKSQLSSIYRKLGVSTRAEAIDWARRHHLG